MSSVPTSKDLMRLRDVTRMTGTLSNVQIAQLKMWPQVILAARKAEVEFDPENYLVIAFVSDLDYASILEGAKEGPTVVYNRRMEKFDQAVKFLLGDEYGVRVILKDKVIGDFAPRGVPRNRSFCETCAATQGKACPTHPIEAE